ncbi:MAG: ribonuclease J [Candidatus Magasanikbacteria bacterium]
MIRKNVSVVNRKNTPEEVTGNQKTLKPKRFFHKNGKTQSVSLNSGSNSKQKNLQRRPSSRPSPIVALKNNSKNLRIIPIGGCEEVGRNMTIFEYEDDIVILDMGIQFPEEDMPGIDYIIPNARYLEKKIKNIRGVVFSHGHLDHIGAAPILLEQLGNPVIVGKDLTLALIKHKQDDYKKGTANKLRTIRINNLTDVVKLGKFTIKFFQVEHSIMDAVGVIIETPNGTVIHPGDWTLARDINGITHINYDHLSNLPKPTVLMLESLGALNDKRHGIYEEIYKNLLNILDKAPGRVIIGTFSSQLERIKWVIESAEKLGKKVALDGYSMKMNVKVAQELGYIKSAQSVLIDVKDVDRYPENKVVVICTGAQGEKNAVLMRIVSKQHRFIQLKKNDTVVFSSSIIPGNERSIQQLKDNIYRQCDNVIHGEIMDVHVSGHATREDILTMLDQIKPTYFIPVYANYYFLREAEQLAVKNGFKKENVFVPDNGSIIEVNKEKAVVLEEKAPSDYVFVDGLEVSDSQHIVLRDRQVLAADGMLVVIATIDSKTGTLIQNPDIISRGFVFLKNNKDLIEDIRSKVKLLVIKSDPKTWADTNQIRNDIRDKIGQFVLSKTEKRPMILPVIIEV